MSDQEMIKRVAKAIAKRDTTDEFAMARAAIEEMLEPTEAMVIAALHHYMACEKEKRPWNGREMYKVMINHILAE